MIIGFIVCFSQCSRGPTPARSRSAASRLARAAGAVSVLAGPSAPRAQSSRALATAASPIRRASLGPQALSPSPGPRPEPPASR